MTAALTATYEPTNSPPRISLHLTGATGSTATITRRNDNGTTYSVRTANPLTLVSGEGQAYDYESPFRQGGVYTATMTDGSTATVTVVGLWEYGVNTPWLIHPGIPDRSMPVTVQSIGSRTQTARQGVHQILGRTDPIVIGDGTRGSESYTLTLRTTWDDALSPSDQQDEDRLRLLLSDGSALLVQVAYEGSRRWRWDWVSVGDVTVDDQVAYLDTDSLIWSLPCTVVRAPSGSQQAQWTYAGVLGRYASYSDLDAAYATYEDMLIDNVST